MKHFTFIAAAVVTLIAMACVSAPEQQHTGTNDEKRVQDIPGTIYDFKVTDIYGNIFDLASLKGKKVMIVNTASECGLTPQYEQLEQLFEAYKDKNFTIIGFPANNFAGQEPGSNEEIASFCKANYGVSFPMMGKISVKGDDMHPLYSYLTQKSQNGLEDSEVQWNFQKYLIGTDGKLQKIILPRTLPNDPSVVAWIEGK